MISLILYVLLLQPPIPKEAPPPPKEVVTIPKEAIKKPIYVPIPIDEWRKVPGFDPDAAPREPSRFRFRERPRFFRGGRCGGGG